MDRVESTRPPGVRSVNTTSIAPFRSARSIVSIMYSADTGWMMLSTSATYTSGAAAGTSRQAAAATPGPTHATRQPIRKRILVRHLEAFTGGQPTLPAAAARRIDAALKSTGTGVRFMRLATRSLRLRAEPHLDFRRASPVSQAAERALIVARFELGRSDRPIGSRARPSGHGSKTCGGGRLTFWWADQTI
jgi:hypothetical protein